jgi:hypothetical protein
MGKRVQSDRGEIARLHITIQRPERWVCELFIGHWRTESRLVTTGRLDERSEVPGQMAR